MADPVAQSLAVGALVLRLGEVDRATQHPNGRPESDTTHTVMLALVALLAAPPHLNRELLLTFALVHDLVEAYAGDTNTAKGLTSEVRAAKKAREAQALERIREEVPQLAALVDRYEAQDTPEAEFIHVLDKVMPKVCHTLNRGRSLDDLGMTLADVRRSHRTHGAELARQHPNQHAALSLFWGLARIAEDTIQESHHG